MGKMVVQTFLFNIDSNWLVGLFPSTVLLRILLRFITLYYNYQFRSSISTGSMKKSPGSQAGKCTSPLLQCAAGEVRVSRSLSKESPKQPQFRTSNSFAASRGWGFYRPLRPSQYGCFPKIVVFPPKGKPTIFGNISISISQWAV